MRLMAVARIFFLINFLEQKNIGSVLWQGLVPGAAQAFKETFLFAVHVVFFAVKAMRILRDDDSSGFAELPEEFIENIRFWDLDCHFVRIPVQTGDSPRMT